MKLLSAFSIAITLFFFQPLLGQTKNEQETRIKFSGFPMNAQLIVNKLPERCRRIKFYKETDGDKQSFETKFKYKGQWYSLEFSKDGIVEDIEVITKFKHIETSKQRQIKNYFEQSYEKYNLIKIQKQYVYSPEGQASDFVNEILSESPEIAHNFEIIAEVRTDKQRNIKEFTFDNEGAFINYRLLNPSSYEHVLY
ncbi:hypothetical protein [Winogradskyella forsetii]|uniref:hypothetical protein n=1 Tax=Winogradskyella forsetii TaxID=2686077 RepID=UPI0015BF7794|nr:hypothetical protein [Winogradskyella forsetii]